MPGSGGRQLILRIMKYKLLLLLASIFVLSCSSPAPSGLDTDAFEQRLNSTDEKIILDVRTPAEYHQGHLSDATLIDVQGSDFEAKVGKLDKSMPVFVYCASGIRSEKAVRILRDQGFTKIFELEGGLRELADAGKPLERN